MLLGSLGFTDPPQLLDRCLKIVDPELYAHLRSKNLSAEIYAFPCTFCLWILRSMIDTDGFLFQLSSRYVPARHL